MQNKILLFILILSIHISAQTVLTIPQIQGSGTSSSYTSKLVKTTGIVTAKFIGTGKIGGYFLQDPDGDGNIATSDGIFVSTTSDVVSVGDKVTVTGTVTENSTRTQIGTVTAQTVVSSGNTLPVTKVLYNADTFNWEQYEGMLLQFNQTLYVNSNYYFEQYGQLSLYPSRLYSPTNQFLPGTTDYSNLVNANAKTQITLDDGITTSNYTPLPLADVSGTRRTGERVTGLLAIADYSGSSWVIYPASTPVFYGNSRPLTPTNLGNYNLKVCAANLEYYLPTNYGQGYGPSTATEAAHQQIKIVSALLAIDADIYGLVEIEEGQTALSTLATALNSATVAGRYSYIDDAGSINGTYTKVGYLYRTDKVTPYLSLKNNNSPTPMYRKKAQAFTLKSNSERFIFCLNHFKAKSGCSSATGTDADQGDGQSCYNATRVAEATSDISFLNTCKTYYSDQDVLIMGDLNAYTKEDPIQTFVNAGYTDMHRAFHADTAYSYVYNGQAGYLDHALASASLKTQITGVTVFHVNADEPSMFEYSGTAYKPDMYRYSDHDPVVAGILLGNINVTPVIDDNMISVFPTIIDDNFTVSNAAGATIILYSVNGTKLLQLPVDNDEQQIKITDLYLNSGVYIVRVDKSDESKRMLILKK